MSYSLSQSALHSILFGDEEVVRLFSAEADLATCVTFEVALAAMQAQAGLVPSAAAKAIAKALADYAPRPDKFAAAMARDGVAVPSLVAELRKLVLQQHAMHLHLGATSQDVIDTSLMLRAAAAVVKIENSLAQGATALKALDRKFGKEKLMGHTRMQQALDIRAADKLAVWQSGISTAQSSLRALRFPLQLGGPVGVINDQKLKRALASALGLDHLDHCWQAERSPIVAIGNACAHVTGACGKIGQDIALMAQNEMGEIKLSGGGTSSAMAHKQNPVKAEVLVSLARFNATQISALNHAMVHEQERSGAAWTLEWMILPQMIVAAATAARIAVELFGSVVSIGK